MEQQEMATFRLSQEKPTLIAARNHNNRANCAY